MARLRPSVWGATGRPGAQPGSRARTARTWQASSLATPDRVNLEWFGPANTSSATRPGRVAPGPAPPRPRLAEDVFDVQRARSAKVERRQRAARPKFHPSAGA